MIDILSAVAGALSTFTRFEDLGLSPVALQIGSFSIKWYSLAYLAGILLGYWYMLKLIAQPGAPWARRHADDMIFYATLGIIIGGRLGYVFFYQPEILKNPIDVFKVWEGGMSLHGGAIGLFVATWLLCRKERLNLLRVCDYIAVVVPFGLFFGRLANFVNGELWGRATDVSWAIIFPRAGEVPRHPSQLYEAGLEGLLYFAILSLMFWRTDARYQPGKLTGAGLVIYGLSRFAVEFVREPDVQLQWLKDATSLSMGQWLTMPMILLGLWLIVTAKRRRVRVDPTLGNQSVA